MTVSTRTINGYAVVKALGDVGARSIMGYAVSEPMWPSKTIEVSDVSGYALVQTPSPVEVHDVGGYILYRRPPQVEVHDVGGYAVYMPPATVEVHDVGGYVLRRPVQPLPKNITGYDAVIKMIIATQDVEYEVTDFSLEYPLPWTSDVQNTVVACKGEAGSYLYGKMDFYYRRREISAILPTGVDRLPLVMVGKTNTLELLPELNAITGMILTEDDIVSAPIASGQTSAFLVAKTTSWFFLPGTTMKVGDSSVVPLSSAFTNSTLIWS